MSTDEGDQTGNDLRKWLEELRGLDLIDHQVEQAVQHLLKSGEAAVSILVEQFGDEDETLLAVATQGLKAWPTSSPVEPLLGLLRSPAVGDLAKALILSVLEHHGLDVDDPEIFGLGINLEDYPLKGTHGGTGGTEES